MSLMVVSVGLGCLYLYGTELSSSVILHTPAFQLQGEGKTVPEPSHVCWSS